MGAVPKRKISTMRKGRRRRAISLKKLNLISCKQCGEKKLSHQSCPACGSK